LADFEAHEHRIIASRMLSSLASTVVSAQKIRKFAGSYSHPLDDTLTGSDGA